MTNDASSGKEVPIATMVKLMIQCTPLWLKFNDLGNKEYAAVTTVRWFLFLLEIPILKDIL